MLHVAIEVEMSSQTKPRHDPGYSDLERRAIAAGEPVRYRNDSKEFVHDFSFGAPADTPFGRRHMGHSICGAHDLRTQNGQS